jgi:hypothetical protein
LREEDAVNPDTLRQVLQERVIRDIRNIGCIYPTVGQALYEEPIQRLAGRITTTVLDELKLQPKGR